MPVNVDVALTDYGGGIFSIHGNLGKEFAYEVPDSYGTGTGESCEGKCARIYQGKCFELSWELHTPHTPRHTSHPPTPADPLPTLPNRKG